MGSPTPNMNVMFNCWRMHKTNSMCTRLSFLLPSWVTMLINVLIMMCLPPLLGAGHLTLFCMAAVFMVGGTVLQCSGLFCRVAGMNKYFKRNNLLIDQKGYLLKTVSTLKCRYSAGMVHHFNIIGYSQDDQETRLC